MTATDPKPYGPTWYAATMVAAPERGSLSHNLDVDVCVIGGGLAGLTTARELARRGWSVAVLEARRVAWNASGRNAGFVSAGFAERIEAIVDRVGLKRAKELWGLSAQGVEYVRAAISDTGMPGVAPVDGKITVRRTDDEEALLRHVAMMRVDFDSDAEAWPTEQVREVLRSRVYFQAAHLPSAFHIHALNYALGLAAAAEAAGARIFEETPVLAIDPDGVRKRIETPSGLIRAGHVVLAGGAHLGSVYPLVAQTVVPIATYIATTGPLGERLLDAIRYTGAVADTRRAADYYRIIDGDRLLWGGRITTRVSTPRRLASLMRRDIRKVYPQLGEIEIEHAWSGLMGYAVHKMPQIGAAAPGVWLAGAFGGHGLNTTAMAGELIAGAIVDGDDRWRLFSPYELVWAGGRLGRSAAQAIYWSMQVRDAIAERLARYGERARHRAVAKAARLAVEAARRKAAEAERRAGAEAMRAAAEEVAARLAQAQRQAAEEAARRAREERERRVQERAEEEAALWVAQERARLAAEAEMIAETERHAAEESAGPAREASERRLAEAARLSAAHQIVAAMGDEEAERLARTVREAQEGATRKAQERERRAAEEAAAHRTFEEGARRAAQELAEQIAGAQMRVAEPSRNVAEVEPVSGNDLAADVRPQDSASAPERPGSANGGSIDPVPLADPAPLGKTAPRRRKRRPRPQDR